MGRIRTSLEQYFNGLWYEQSEPGLAWRAAARLYGLSAVRNNSAYRTLPPVPVIVVGNITVGGGGKTPVVSTLAAALAHIGRRPAIISRGYGGLSPSRPLRVQGSDDPRISGDEPLLLARATGCPVWVCRKRRSAMYAAIDEGADVVLSDDGLQHMALPRSFEICVIDEARGFGNGRLLPAGPLRQPLTRLDFVDLVLRKRAGKQPTSLSLPGVPFLLESHSAYRLDDRQPVKLDPETTFDAVCGIANPESFFATLAARELKIRRHVFPDHHAFRAQDVAEMKGPLIVTEKDAVKLERLAGLPETLVVPVRARLPETVIRAVVTHVREFAAS